jgi:hypothetical protein
MEFTIPNCIIPEQSPPPFRFYIIFHKFLTPIAYEKLSPHYLQKYCRFIGVNASIEKHVEPSFYPLLFEEQQLPNYNPFLQHNKFCESSVFIHTYRNAQLLLDPYEFVGFLQYDMVLEDKMFETIENTLKDLPNPEKKFFFHFAENSARHLLQVIDNEGWTVVIDMYNKFFSTNHTLEEVLNANIPLYHTYLIPKQIFRKMMGFAEMVIPHLFGMLGFDTHHMPYHLERLHGIFLALQTMDGHIDMWIRLPGLEHRNDLKDPWQEIENAKRKAAITP